MSLPLTGLKVLDLSRLLPGPYATLVLADLGATVDKVEDPQGGDYARQMPPMKGETSALFQALNRNKRSLTLDLKSAAGVAALKRLVVHYDVLVETFRPGVMERLGVGFEVLSAVSPRLIYCAISGYGATGPDRLRAGHDINYLARSGVLAAGGQAGGAPALPGVQIADVGGGSLFSLVGILAALHERHRTGRGRFVDISMTEGALGFLQLQLGARLLLGAEGVPPQRGRDPLNGGFACYGLYQTSDSRWLAVGALEPKFFQGLCELLGRPELMPGGYDTGTEGARTRRELEAIFMTKPLAEWAALFRQHDLCVEPVLEGDEVLDDPQLRSRGVFLEENDVLHLRTPLSMGRSVTTHAPMLGAQSREILEQAGFSPDEIAALQR